MKTAANTSDVIHLVAPGKTQQQQQHQISTMQQRLRAVLQRFPRVKKCTLLRGEEDSFYLTLAWPDGEADRNKTVLQRFTSKGPDGVPQLLPKEVVAQCPSPSNARVATLVSEEAGEDKKKLRVEVWDALRGQIASVQVEDVHGPFLAGEGITWHQSEKIFAYVADQKVPTGTDPEAFKFREDWGEQYDGVVQPSIFLFDLTTCKTYPAIPVTNKTQLSPVFAPRDEEILLAYTQFLHDPFKLGLVYCAQRPSEVRMASFALDSSAGPKLVKDWVVSKPSSPGSGTAKSPRFTLDAERLLFLSAPSMTTHQGPVQISVANMDIAKLETTEPKILVDIPSLKQKKHPEHPDLYLEALPASCFTSTHLFLTSVKGCQRHIVKVGLESGAVEFVAVKPSNGYSGTPKRAKALKSVDNAVPGSQAVLAVSRETGRVLILDNSIAGPGVIRWLDDAEAVFNVGRQVQHSIAGEVNEHNAPSRKGDHGGKFDSILMLPAEALEAKDASRKFPLIVYPHGGPHSAFTADYSAEMAFLCEELQAGILMVNYRGSIGAEKVQLLQSLPGHCGDHDVKDVILALEDTLAKHQKIFDPSLLAVMGGSHGGFLTAHLIGQYPTRFKVAVMRNPVTDIPAMSTVTDIPDWCFVEAQGLDAFDFKGFTNFPPTAETYVEMFKSSPVRYIDAVKTPTLIAIGDKDRRVPCSQGLAYYRALKVRNLPAKLMRFPKDSHPIDRAASNEVQWTTAIEFIKEHLK